MEATASETKVFIENRGVEAWQVRKALEIARDNYINSPGDYITFASISLLMKKIPDTNESVRGFFRRRFVDEVQIAQETGLKKESIGSEAGVWKYVFPTEERDIETAKSLVWEGLESAKKLNDEGLMRMHSSGPAQDVFDFDKRLDKEYQGMWEDYLAKNKDTKTGEGFKDWGLRFNPESGETSAREDNNIESLFKVEVISKDENGEIERGIGEVTENGFVAKVLLIENEMGQISDVEILMNHFSNDEEQGRKILKEVAKRLKIADRDIHGTRVNRKYQIKDTDGEIVTVCDVDSSYVPSKIEEETIRGGLKTFDNSMNLSVYLSQVWLGMNGGQSAYICVLPNKPRDKEKNIASLLQFALLPKIAGFEQLGDVIGRTELLPGFVKEYRERLNNLNNFMHEEIDRCQKAIGTVAVLDTFLPDISRKVFRTLFRRQNSLVSEGSVQVSSVYYKKDEEEIENFDKVIFVSALSETTDGAIAVSSFSDSKTIDLKFRTDRKLHDEAKRRLIEGDLIPNQSNIEAMLKKIIEEKVTEFRMALVVLSAGLMGKNVDEIDGVISKTKQFLI